MLGWDELVETFVRVTGLPAIYADVPYSKWIESIPIAQGPVAREVPNGPTFAEDFEKVGLASRFAAFDGSSCLPCAVLERLARRCRHEGHGLDSQHPPWPFHG